MVGRMPPPPPPSRRVPLTIIGVSAAVIIAVGIGMFIAHQRVAAVTAVKETEAKEVDTTLEAVKLAGVSREEAAAYAKTKAALEAKGVRTGLVLVTVNGKDEWLPADWMSQVDAKVRAQGEIVKLTGELQAAQNIAKIMAEQNAAVARGAGVARTHEGGDGLSAEDLAVNAAEAERMGRIFKDGLAAPEPNAASSSVSFDYRWQAAERAPVIPDPACIGDRLVLMDVLVEHFHMSREALNLKEITYRDLVDIYWKRVQASGQPAPYPARGPAKPAPEPAKESP